MLINYFITLFFTVVAKGFLSAVEFAVKSVQRRVIISNSDTDENDTNGKSMDKYIITINVLKSIVMICFGGFVFNNIGDVVSSFNIANNSSFAYYLTEFIILIITLYVIVIFGGFIPKKFAVKFSKKISSVGIIPIKIIYYLGIVFFYPFVALSAFLSKLFGIHQNIHDDYITQEEIMMLIDAGGEKGAIDDDEREMLTNVFEFDDKIAGDIVTHRKDIVALSLNSDVEDIIKIVLDEKYSRIPVYEESIDNIIGILHIKDVMKYLLMFGKNNFDIKKVMMEPYFVPFTKKTDELFKEMQENKIHLSVVLDEYGGTLGIVSMEDLIEEVMGNILDEYDDDETPEIISNDGINFYIDGKTDYKDVCEYLEITPSNDDEEEYDTVSGFLIGKMGHIPEVDENFQFELENYIFSVEKVEDNRISLIKAVKKEPVENPKEEISAE